MATDTLIQALLDAESPEEQLSLCGNLLPTMAKGDDDSVRSMLGNLDASSIMDFLEVLSSLMSAQDASSLTAGQVYARLLASKGAFSAGLVDMQALSSLAAAVRHWAAGGAKPVEESLQPTKRSRRAVEDEDAGDLVEEVAEGTSEIVQQGLHLADSLGEIVSQKDFMYWPTESRETIFKSATLALAVSAATAVKLPAATPVVQRLARSLQECIVLDAPVPFDSDFETKRLDSTIALYRGLVPIVQLQEKVPGGEQGKTAAATAATNVLAGFLGRIADERSLNGTKKSSKAAATPSRTPRRSLGGDVATPATARRTPSARLSIGGSSGGETITLTPPKLKNSPMKTPMSVMKTAEAAADFAPVVRATLGMLQKLTTTKTLEKTNVRSSCVAVVRASVAQLLPAARAYFLRFLAKQARSKIAIHRRVATELLGHVLSEEWIWTNGMGSPGGRPMTPASRRMSGEQLQDLPGALFLALQDRLHDKEPSVRVASMNALSAVFQSISGDWESQNAKDRLISAVSQSAFMMQEDIRSRAARDDRALVRKSAIDAFTELLRLSGAEIGVYLVLCEDDINVLSNLCNDDASTARKAAADALTCLLKLEYQSADLSRMMERAWLSSALPLVLDSEKRCAAKAFEFVDQAILEAIVKESEGESNLAWRLLAGVASRGIASNAMAGLRRALKEKISMAASPKDVLRPLFSVISATARRLLDQDNDSLMCTQFVGLWGLLDALLTAFSEPTSAVTKYLKSSRVNFDFVGESLDRMLDYNVAVDMSEALVSVKHCLRVIATLSAGVTDPLGGGSRTALEQRLIHMALPVEVMSTALKAAFPSPITEKEEAVSRLFAACESEIDSFVRDAADMDVSGDSSLARAVFTAGELCLLGFTGKEDSSANDQRIQPPHRLVELIHACLPTTLPGSHQRLTPDLVRAHAFLAVGKMCLRDEALVDRNANVFARELSVNMQNGSRAVQSNALVVLGDLFVRYTNKVDRFLPEMAACLQAGTIDLSVMPLDSRSDNAASTVRVHAVQVLTKLLVQRYAKPRGLLFHRFLVASTDECDAVARAATAALYGPLASMDARIFVNHFVESLFVLNRCTGHPLYAEAAVSGDGGSGIAIDFSGINLSGEIGRQRRQEMYEVMLERMSPEDKISVTVRIAKQVFENALEAGSVLNRACCQVKTGSALSAEHEGAVNVIGDAFMILMSKSIKLARQRDSEVLDATSTAKGKLLSSVSRKHAIEVLLPLLAKLKDLLQQNLSPLMKDLMGCLMQVYRTYKADVTEVLKGNDLLVELEHDAKRMKGRPKSLGSPAEADD